MLKRLNLKFPLFAAIGGARQEGGRRTRTRSSANSSRRRIWTSESATKSSGRRRHRRRQLKRSQQTHRRQRKLARQRRRHQPCYSFSLQPLFLWFVIEPRFSSRIGENKPIICVLNSSSVAMRMQACCNKRTSTRLPA